MQMQSDTEKGNEELRDVSNLGQAENLEAATDIRVDGVAATEGGDFGSPPGNETVEDSKNLQVEVCGVVLELETQTETAIPVPEDANNNQKNEDIVEVPDVDDGETGNKQIKEELASASHENQNQAALADADGTSVEMIESSTSMSQKIMEDSSAQTSQSLLDILITKKINETEKKLKSEGIATNSLLKDKIPIVLPRLPLQTVAPPLKRPRYSFEEEDNFAYYNPIYANNVNRSYEDEDQMKMDIENHCFIRGLNIPNVRVGKSQLNTSLPTTVSSNCQGINCQKETQAQNESMELIDEEGTSSSCKPLLRLGLSRKFGPRKSLHPKRVNRNSEDKENDVQS